MGEVSRNHPWDKIEEEYASLFSDIGSPAKPVRMALGAFIIKKKMGFPECAEKNLQ